MSKILYNHHNIKRESDPIILDLPDKYKKYQQLDELQEFGLDLKGEINEKYDGPSIEQVEAEIKKYKDETEKEINRKKKDAEKRREEIVEESKLESFRLIQNAKEKTKEILSQAKLEAEQILERAKLDNERMLKEVEIQVSQIEHDAWQQGYDAGREVGYKEGQAEVKRIIDRLGSVLGHAIDIKEKIIYESEKQMVDIILMITRKVIKDEIVERKEIVINNIKEAMLSVKNKDRIDIRVNFADLEVTTAHKSELIGLMETLKRINVYEDSRIDRGGVVIETEIGSIDARISSQLTEIERVIRDIQPN